MTAAAPSLAPAQGSPLQHLLRKNQLVAPTTITANVLERFFQAPQPATRPCLPALSSRDDVAYVIILDLDETLLHTEWLKATTECYIVHERPFVREFLRSLKKLPVEVIIFTAGVQSYADTVIDILDKPTQTICHRLYRQHTTAGYGNQRWKDLSLLNRDLSRTLIIDNSPEAFQHHLDNGFAISPWEGHRCLGRGKVVSVEDHALLNLFYWMEYLCIKRLAVPDFVRLYRSMVRLAVGDQTRPAPKDYRPPFRLGPVSCELLERCLPRRLAPTSNSSVSQPSIPPFMSPRGPGDYRYLAASRRAESPVVAKGNLPVRGHAATDGDTPHVSLYAGQAPRVCAYGWSSLALEDSAKRRPLKSADTQLPASTTAAAAGAAAGSSSTLELKPPRTAARLLLDAKKGQAGAEEGTNNNLLSFIHLPKPSFGSDNKAAISAVPEATTAATALNAVWRLLLGLNPAPASTPPALQLAANVPTAPAVTATVAAGTTR